MTKTYRKGGVGAMKGAYLLNSGTLRTVAVSAYERLNSAPADKAGGQNDALVAILFSAATLEAFIMELALLAQSDSVLLENKWLQSVMSALNDSEASRSSIRLKFLLTRLCLGGEAYDKSSQPYQDFDTLFTLRNAIIHMKPEKIQEEEYQILRQLRAKGLCEDAEPGVKSSWLSQICTRAVARWSCNVVIDMVESLKACLPAEPEKTPFMSAFLNSWYKRVE